MRPCTIEDFKGFEEIFEIDSGGVESLFCPGDRKSLQVKGSYNINPLEEVKTSSFIISSCQTQYNPACE